MALGVKGYLVLRSDFYGRGFMDSGGGFVDWGQESRIWD